MADSRVQGGVRQSRSKNRIKWRRVSKIHVFKHGALHSWINSIRKLGDMFNLKEDELFELYLNSVLDEVTKSLKRKFYGRS